jgi:hypothetical protein
MPSSWMLRRAALVRTDVSEERSASIIRGTRIGELGTKLVVSSNGRTLCPRRRHSSGIEMFLGITGRPVVLYPELGQVGRASGFPWESMRGVVRTAART